MTSQKPLLVPYRVEWETGSAELISILRAKLGHAAVRIEHVGSTAIPSMTSKDVIDLQVSVLDLESATLTFDGPLSALGFEQSPFQADHVPAGLDNDPPTGGNACGRVAMPRQAASTSMSEGLAPPTNALRCCSGTGFVSIPPP